MILEPVGSIVALSLSIVKVSASPLLLFPLLPEMVKATSFLLSFIQRYSPSKELLDWLEHAINKIVDRDTISNVINLFICLPPFLLYQSNVTSIRQVMLTFVLFLSGKYKFFGKNLLGTDILCYTIHSSLSFLKI